MFDCLETYYKCLTLTIDIHALVRDVRQLFYSLYDGYAKFYDPFLNISFGHDAHSTQAPIGQIGKDYQLLFQRTKKITKFLFIIKTKLNLRALKLLS